MRLDPQYVSGLKEGTPRPNVANATKVIEIYRNQAFPGFGYLIEEQTAIAECNARCAQDDKCVAFTFKNREETCSLFSSVDHYAPSQGADGGIKRQPPP